MVSGSKIASPRASASSPWRRCTRSWKCRWRRIAASTPLVGANRSEAVNRAKHINTMIGPVGSCGAEAETAAPR